MVLFLDNVLNLIRRRSAPPTKTVGVPGHAVFGGFVQQIEEDARLQGRTRYEEFSEVLANCSVVAAGVRFFLNLAGKARWRVEPAEGGGARADEVAEIVDEIMGDMRTPWHRVVRRAAMYRYYGFSLLEWTAKRREDGLIGYLDVEPRPQITIEQWDVDRDGTVHGVVQRSPQTQEAIYIPRAKLVYLVDDSLNDSPEGLGLFRHVVEPARQLREMERHEGKGYEADLRGVPVGRAPFEELARKVAAGDLSAADKATIEKPIRDFVENHVRSEKLGLYLDSQPYRTTDDKQTPSGEKLFDIELLKSGATSLGDVNAAIMRKQREIARVLGIEQLLLGESGTGSLAMSRDKSQNFALTVDSSLKELAESLDQDWLGPLMMLNGWPEDLRPIMKPERIQHRDVEEITAALKDLALAGFPLAPDDEAGQEVRDLLGLSRLETMDADADAALASPRAEPEMPEDVEETEDQPEDEQDRE